MWLGCHFGRALRAEGLAGRHASILIHWTCCALALIAAGVALHASGAILMSKQLWSLSYLLYMGGTCGLALAACYLAMDCPRPAGASGDSVLPLGASGGSCGGAVMAGGRIPSGGAGGDADEERDGSSLNSRAESLERAGGAGLRGTHASTSSQRLGSRRASSSGSGSGSLSSSRGLLGPSSSQRSSGGHGRGAHSGGEACASRLVSRAQSVLRLWLFPLEAMGMNAILFFFWHGTAEALINAVYFDPPAPGTGPHGTNLTRPVARSALLGESGWVHESLLALLSGDPRVRQLLFVLIKLAVYLAVAVGCWRRRYFWKL